MLEQQNSGVTINVVTKRGTNEVRGAARYMYASGNWQSNNTPPEAAAQGLPTNNTRMIREYGADLGGPIMKDKMWLWFAGSYQTIATNSATFDSTAGEFSSPETTNLEPWSAKLNWQISNGNSAQLFYQRSDRDQQNRGAAPFRPPDTQTSLMIPTNFYKVEDSQVFSSDFFASIFANYQNPDYNQVANGSRDCNPQRYTVPCAGNGNKDIQYYANPDGSNLTFHNNYYYYWAKDPQKQANLHDVEVLQHREAQPRAEVQLQLPPADRRLAVRPAGQSEPGPVLLERQQQPVRPALPRRPDRSTRRSS